MNIDRKYIDAIRRIALSINPTFSNLVMISGLDPKHDFEYRDLSHLDFGDADLRQFSFYRSDLRFSKLDRCIIDETTNLLEARLDFAYLPRELVGKFHATYFVLFIGIDTDRFRSIERKTLTGNIEIEYSDFGREREFIGNFMD